MELYVTVENIESKALDWFERIRPYNQHEMQLKAEASALLVVDMQRFFLDADTPAFTCGGQAILPTVMRLVDAFRRANRPVIFTRARHGHRYRGESPPQVHMAETASRTARASIARWGLKEAAGKATIRGTRTAREAEKRR